MTDSLVVASVKAECSSVVDVLGVILTDWFT